MTGIAVLGAGAWGTALATMLAGGGHRVTLWARSPDRARAMAESRVNAPYLPEIRLDPALAIVSGDPDFPADLRIAAVPAQHLRALLHRLSPQAGRVPTIVTAKGIETATGRFMDELAAEAAPGATIALLSGPSFAAEVARGLPAAVTLACRDPAAGAALARRLALRHFRLYWTDDVRGVALGGALKNVLAIAAGIVMGRGLGESARAALVTRGLSEMMRLGAALGARRETMIGLSGLGDLLLTATSAASRNTALGIALGRGLPPPGGGVTEGVYTAAAALAIARRAGVEVPVTAAVDAVLNRGASIDAAILGLLDRPTRPEPETGPAMVDPGTEVDLGAEED